MVHLWQFVAKHALGADGHGCAGAVVGGEFEIGNGGGVVGGEQVPGTQVSLTCPPPWPFCARETLGTDFEPPAARNSVYPLVVETERDDRCTLTTLEPFEDISLYP